MLNLRRSLIPRCFIFSFENLEVSCVLLERERKRKKEKKKKREKETNIINNYNFLSEQIIKRQSGSDYFKIIEMFTLFRSSEIL